MPLDRGFPVVALGQMKVVLLALERDAVGRVVAAVAVGVPVMELEPAPFVAAAATSAEKGTATSVALVDGTPRCGREMAGAE